MSIAGSSSIRRLEDVAIVMDLHELAPVGGRAAGRRHRRRLERFTHDRKSAATGGCQECEGQEWFMIRRKQPVIPVPMLSRRRDEIGQPVQELKRREFDQAVRAGPRGRSAAAGADPVGRFVSREHGADADVAAVGVADHGEPFKREWRPGAVPQQVFEGLTRDTQLGRKSVIRTKSVG